MIEIDSAIVYMWVKQEKFLRTYTYTYVHTHISLVNFDGDKQKNRLLDFE